MPAKKKGLRVWISVEDDDYTGEAEEDEEDDYVDNDYSEKDN